MNAHKSVRLCLMVLFAAVFCYSAFRLIRAWRLYSQNEAIYDDAADQFLIYHTDTQPQSDGTTAPMEPDPVSTNATSADTVETTPASEDGTLPATEPATVPTTPKPVETAPPPNGPDFTPNWDALHRANPDIVGWIWQSGTVINYPVLKGADNNQYLRTTYNGKSSRLGSIFLDYRSDLSARNPVIYGHNAGNGRMFASLVKYKKRSYLEANPYLYLMTPAGTAKYAVFSVYETTTASDTYTFTFEDDAAYAAYLSEIQMRSAYRTGVAADSSDEILTLSTCTNTGKTIRYVVHAKRIPLD